MKEDDDSSTTQIYEELHHSIWKFSSSSCSRNLKCQNSFTCIYSCNYITRPQDKVTPANPWGPAPRVGGRVQINSTHCGLQKCLFDGLNAKRQPILLFEIKYFQILRDNFYMLNLNLFFNFHKIILLS